MSLTFLIFFGSPMNLLIPENHTRYDGGNPHDKHKTFFTNVINNSKLNSGNPVVHIAEDSLVSKFITF